MTAVWMLARALFWGAIGFVLCVFAPLGLALLVVGHALIHASYSYRDGLVWVLERLERITRDASERTR